MRRAATMAGHLRVAPSGQEGGDSAGGPGRWVTARAGRALQRGGGAWVTGTWSEARGRDRRSSGYSGRERGVVF